MHGQGADLTPAKRVAAEIVSSGGRAAASGHDVSDWDQAGQMIVQAIEAFARLDVLVNNAGILRDRTLANMAEDEWDAGLRVHLKGHAAPARHVLTYWRDQSKEGHEVKASVIHTSSVAAFAGNIGQANYAAAKIAVLALSRVISLEAGRYGVRSNVVSPSGRTRITAGVEEDAVSDPRVEYQQADLFEWTPRQRYDLVFFAFWLSHVPPESRGRVSPEGARCGAPGGHLFMIDQCSYPGPEWQARFVAACRELDISHRRTRPRHAWTNGFVERLQGTILSELWRVAFRRTYYRSVGQLEQDLQAYLRFYNRDRPHQGYRLQGRTPAAIFLAKKAS